MSTEDKNTLGAISTIFELPQEVWNDLLKNHDEHINEIEIRDIKELNKGHEEQELQRLKDDVVFQITRVH